MTDILEFKPRPKPDWRWVTDGDESHSALVWNWPDGDRIRVRFLGIICGSPWWERRGTLGAVGPTSPPECDVCWERSIEDTLEHLAIGGECCVA